MAAPEPAPPPQVAVLLATYCGEPFLPEQLDSLAGQRGVAWRLLWRDDGSADGTIAVLDSFAATQPPGRVQRCPDPPGRLGASRSFLALLAAAPAEAGLFAFCDQDDVWLPDKLSRAAAMLAACRSGHPALYCARQRLVGPNLEPLGLSPALQRPPGFANALVQNIATGCTMVLNGAARRVVLEGPPPPEGTLHDWWCYLLVTAAGGEVVWDEEPALLYRQHGTNSVGAPTNALSRWLGAMRRGARPYLARIVAQAEALEQAPHLTREARQAIAAMRGLRGRWPLGRLRALHEAGVHRQGWLDDLMLRFWVAMHGAVD